MCTYSKLAVKMREERLNRITHVSRYIKYVNIEDTAGVYISVVHPVYYNFYTYTIIRNVLFTSCLTFIIYLLVNDSKSQAIIDIKRKKTSLLLTLIAGQYFLK